MSNIIIKSLKCSKTHLLGFCEYNNQLVSFIFNDNGNIFIQNSINLSKTDIQNLISILSEELNSIVSIYNKKYIELYGIYNFDMKINEYYKYLNESQKINENIKEIIKNNITGVKYDIFYIDNIPLEIKCICSIKGMNIKFGDITEKSQDYIIENYLKGYNYGNFIEVFNNIDEVMNFYNIDRKTAIYLSDGIDLSKYLNKKIVF